MNDWMTTQDVADYLKVSRRMIAKLGIPHLYVGRLPRYTRADVDTWMEEQAAKQTRRRAPQGALRVVSSAGNLESDLQALKQRLGRNRIKKGD